MMTKAVTNKDAPVLSPNAQYSRLTNPSPPPRDSSMTDLSKPPAARTAGPSHNNYQANRRGRPYTSRSETTPGSFIPHLPDIDFGGHDLGDNLFVSPPKRRSGPPKQAPIGAAGRSVSEDGELFCDLLLMSHLGVRTCIELRCQTRQRGPCRNFSHGRIFF